MKGSVIQAVLQRSDWSKTKPISGQTFEAYKSLYAYDSGPLDPLSEGKQTFRSWTRERVTFDATNSGKRMVLYLYLPLNGSPPYQTVVFMPGIDAWYTDSVDQFGMPLDFLIKSGRAVAFPVLRGTFERRDGLGLLGGIGFTSQQTTLADRDAFVKVVQDFRRSLDYLVTRPDIAPGSLAYYGLSSGAMMAPNILSQEARFRVAVLSLGGLAYDDLRWPELRPENFFSRVKIPILALILYK